MGASRINRVFLLDLLNLWLGIVGEFAFGMTCGLAILHSQKNLTVDNVKKKKKRKIILNCCCICKSSEDLVHISSLPLVARESWCALSLFRVCKVIPVKVIESFSVWVCLDVIVMI